MVVGGEIFIRVGLLGLGICRSVGRAGKRSRGVKMRVCSGEGVCGVLQGRECAAGVLVVKYPPQFSRLFVFVVLFGHRVWVRVKH